MKSFLKIVGMLTLICTLCGLSLAAVYRYTKERIEMVQKQRIEESIMRILPHANSMKEVRKDGLAYYDVTDTDGQRFYVVMAAGTGYQGTISLITVLDASLQHIVGIEIIDSQETPGLGSRINEDFFKKQFENKDISQALECVKGVSSNPAAVQAITGATISSRSVVNIVNSYIEKLRAAGI